MAGKPIPVPEKHCERCGTLLERTRMNGRLEDRSVFMRRRFCSLHCANSRGRWGESLKTMHKESLKVRGERCTDCGVRPKNLRHLHVHHIDGNWRDNSLSNLVTVCFKCHMKRHREMARAARSNS